MPPGPAGRRTADSPRGANRELHCAPGTTPRACPQGLDGRRPVSGTLGQVTGEPRSPTRIARARRAVVAAELALATGGVAHRRDLRGAGVSRYDVQTEIDAGRWMRAGRHTVVIGNRPPTGKALLWWAVWESGSGAVLDGPSALVAAGLSGYQPSTIDVSIPANNRRHRVDGVTLHRRRVLGPISMAGVPRARPEQATIRAARWATSDRQAALLVCLPVQQRLTTPRRLLDAWTSSGPGVRQAFIRQLLLDVCDGAQSLGELDFAGLCRQHGLEEPTRQAVRVVADGRVYLDAAWDDVGLVVEVDGGHHALALNTIDDALRQNEVVIAGERVLRIPVLGLRLQPRRFMEQVARAHRRASGRAA